MIPAPVDSDACLSAAGFSDFADSDEEWDKDFEHLAKVLVNEIGEGSALEILAPLRIGITGWTRLIRFLTFRPNPLTAAERLNPDGLDATSALVSAAHDDQHLAFAAVSGRSASIMTSNGHPILWVWTGNEAHWLRTERAVTLSWPTRSVAFDFSSLGPPRTFGEGHVVVDAVRQRVAWTEGFAVLSFGGEFLLPHPGNLGCNDPNNVFIPPEDQWAHIVPECAAGAYGRVVHDLRMRGLNIEVREHARVDVVQSNVDGSDLRSDRGRR